MWRPQFSPGLQYRRGQRVLLKGSPGHGIIMGYGPSHIGPFRRYMVALEGGGTRDTYEGAVQEAEAVPIFELGEKVSSWPHGEGTIISRELRYDDTYLYTLEVPRLDGKPDAVRVRVGAENILRG